MTPAAAQRNEVPALAEWSVDRPRDWLRVVNAPQSEPEMEALHRAVQRGRPRKGGGAN